MLTFGLSIGFIVYAAKARGYRNADSTSTSDFAPVAPVAPVKKVGFSDFPVAPPTVSVIDVQQGVVMEEMNAEMNEEMNEEMSEDQEALRNFDERLRIRSNEKDEAANEASSTSTINTLNKFSVQDLKNVLRTKGLRVSGNKAELIARIIECE